MLEVLKISKEFEGVEETLFFKIQHESNTGHLLQLYKDRSHLGVLIFVD